MSAITSPLTLVRTETTAFVLGHRPELDGLRGISILLVLALHLRLGLQGGFLGVDIFFVLSGFLITSLLVQEFDRTGTISLKGFYLRRALRLGPALVLIILAGSTYSIFTGHWPETFQGAWLSLSYISNWLYAFDVYSPNHAFGVTWSLAIEEQFYLAWPILLGLALKLKVKRSTILGFLILTVAIIALHRFSLAMQGATAYRMYYATDTRSDGLLIGCVVGLLLSWGFIPRSKQSVATLKTLTLLGAVFIAFLVLVGKRAYVGFYLGGFTLVSLSIGAVLLLLMLYPPRLALSILRTPALVWIGKVSYGLYLWHWAVIWFVYPKYDPPSIFQVLAAITLSFLCTALSFHFVEKRFLALKDRLKPYSVKIYC